MVNLYWATGVLNVYIRSNIHVRSWKFFLLMWQKGESTEMKMENEHYVDFKTVQRNRGRGARGKEINSAN